MTSHVLDNIKFFSVVGVVIAAILIVGWRQPIRYRFMSRAEIEALERPPSMASPTPWMWDKSRSTTLDRPAYHRDTDYGRRFYGR